MEFTSKITVELKQSVGTDMDILAAARVSTGAASKGDKSDVGTINYLMRHRHGSPFEHALMTFYVHAPLFVFREWHRHRTWSFNEESARYKTLGPVFYLPRPERPMKKEDNWKAARPEFSTVDSHVYESVCSQLAYSYRQSYDAYTSLLSLGIDPGLARDCLPVGIYSSMYATCNPRSLMHFLSLRTHDQTARDVSYPLWEIEVAAREMEAVFAKLFPWTYEAWLSNGRVAP